MLTSRFVAAARRLACARRPVASRVVLPLARRTARPARSCRDWEVEWLEPRTLLSVPPPGPTLQVNTITAGDQSTLVERHAVASDAAGDFVVIWESGEGIPASNPLLYGQRFDAAGARQGGQFLITPPTMHGPFHADVAMDAGGGFVVTWLNTPADPDDPSFGIYSQRYNPQGEAQGAPAHVSNDVDWYRGSPVVAMDADGDYVIAWTHFSHDVLPELAGDDVLAQRFDAAGNPQGGPFTANSDSAADQVFPAVAMDTAGDFVMSWQRNAFAIDSHVLQARLFNSQGFASAQEFAINTPEPQSVSWGPTEVAMDAGGDFAVVWDASYSSGPGGGYQINARRFDASGTPRGGSFPVDDFPSTSPKQPSISMDAAGDFVVSWKDGLFAAQYFDSGGAKVGGAMVIDLAFNPFSGAFGRPTVAMDYDGDFVAAFMNGDNADYDIYARQYGPRPAGGRVGGGVVFHDVNGDGARDADDPGASGWRVYNDLNNNGQFDRSSYPAPSGTTNTPLPPLGSRRYLGPGPSPAQAVGDVITDINVTINIQFPTDGDLTAWLVSPTGRRAQLFSHVGGAGQNFTQTTFDDTGAFSINQGTAPFTGTFHTQNQTLSGFNGEQLTDDGFWMLEVGNDGGNFGAVFSWVLTVSYAEVSAVTGANGIYSLPLPDGAGTVREVPQSGWVQTYPGQGGGQNLPGGGQTVTNLDFGNTRADAIQGHAFLDVNADGARDAVDPGLPGVNVYMDANNNGAFDYSSTTFASADVPQSIILRATSQSALDIAGLPGTVQDLFVTLNISYPNDSDLDVYLISPAGTYVLLFSSVGANGANFTGTTLRDGADQPIFLGFAPFSGTFRPQGLLSNLSGEAPNGRWQLQVVNNGFFPSGVLNSWSLGITSAERSTVTDGTGNYLFTGVTPGTYVVREEVPFGGFEQTRPAGGGPYTVVHTSGQFHRDLDFGNAYGGIVTGLVFNDGNADGVKGSGEDSMGGFKIYADLNNNGQFDPDDASTTSDARGGYTLRGVPMFEPVSLRAIPPDASPYPWEFSLEPARVELSPDQPVATLQNFGAFRRGSLSGLQFNDVNGSGAPDTGEPGLGGWMIYLDQNGNGQRDRSEQAVTTDASGRYSFDALRPGPYSIREQPQAGWVQVAPASGVYDVTLAGGQELGGFAFGSRPVNDPPRVTAVYASSTAWTAPFKSFLASLRIGSADWGFRLGGGRVQQLTPLPWSGVDRLSIFFSDDVQIDQADLAVRGVSTAEYRSSAYAYDPALHVATWTFGRGFAADKLLIDLDGETRTGVRRGEGGPLLDGEWTPGGAYPSGDGSPGGDFRFRFNSLPGDADRNGSVLANDFSQVKQKFFSSTTNPGSGASAYSVFHDVNGSGSILADDFSAVKSHFFDTLPTPAAAAALGAAAIRLQL